jgi:hypothetical protein
MMERGRLRRLCQTRPPHPREGGSTTQTLGSANKRTFFPLGRSVTQMSFCAALITVRLNVNENEDLRF